MRIFIADDEQPARERLRNILAETEGVVIVGEAGNGEDTVASCSELQPDVVLLDIRMPGLDGIETAHHLNRLQNPPAIIFATAYDEYAIEAFDAKAMGYVLKPVRRERLNAALSNAARVTNVALADVASAVGKDTARSHICVQHRGDVKLIPLPDVACFRADEKYVVVEHLGGQHLIDEPLKALAREFEATFVRVHRSVLVAIRFIDRIERRDDGKSAIVLREGSQVDSNQLIISRRHLPMVKKRLKEA